jgi:hypothetical protein
MLYCFKQRPTLLLEGCAGATHVTMLKKAAFPIPWPITGIFVLFKVCQFVMCKMAFCFHLHL